MNKMFATSEAQAAYETAYELGLKNEDLPTRKYENTVEDAAMHLATVIGYAEGVQEHYRRKGVYGAFFPD